MSEFNSSMMCCIAGCTHYGSRQDRDGRLFCAAHWDEHVREDPNCQDCNACTQSCAVRFCINPGPYTRSNVDGLLYCTKHIFRTNRPDSLNHPNTAQWDEQDEIRAHGLGITIKEKK